MDYLKLLMLKVDCTQEVLTRELFHTLIQKLKIFPDYFKITKNSFK